MFIFVNLSKNQIGLTDVSNFVLNEYEFVKYWSNMLLIVHNLAAMCVI